MKLTRFDLLERQVRRLGPDAEQTKCCTAFSQGGAIVAESDLVVGKEGIYWLNMDGLATKVSLCVVSTDFIMHAQALDAKKPRGRAKSRIETEIEQKAREFSYHLFNCETLRWSLRTAVGKTVVANRSPHEQWRIETDGRRYELSVPLCEHCKTALKQMFSDDADWVDGQPPIPDFFSGRWAQRWVVGVYSTDESVPPDIYPKDWEEITAR